MDTEGVRSALAEGRFDDASELLGTDPPEGVATAPWLELRAEAAYGAGDFDLAVLSWERLHDHHLRHGRRADAARAAAMTALLLLCDSGLMSAVRGWVRRAERLLDDDSGAVHALLAAVSAYERFMCGDMAAATVLADRATDLGERFEAIPARLIGLTATGRLTILEGDVEGGLAVLDEVAALLLSPTTDPFTRGMMYCELICAAQGIARLDRAREWADQMQRWALDGPGSIRGRCRVHRAELLRASGPADQAEDEALAACEELRPWMRREFGWPLVELGMIRLRRGDLEAAERDFEAAADHGWPPHPGLALVRLDQGEVTDASALISVAIAHPVDAPSKELPPWGDLRLVPLLDAQSEIAMADDDAVTVDAAATRLRDAAERYPGPVLRAIADLASARARLQDGDTAGALALANTAAVEFLRMDAVFDAARAREVLAGACAMADSPEAERFELAAAERLYRGYGATRRADAIAERLATSSPTRSSAHRAPDPARAVFRRAGDGWFVDFAGRSETLKDLKGLRYVHRLMASPGREIHVLDLVAAENGAARGEAGTPADLTAHRGEAGLEVLDDAAIDAYRRRLAEAADDIDDAARCNDPDRLAKAEADRDFLIAELNSAVGLGGRTRRTGGSSERARTSVARTVRYALDELDPRHRLLAEHLRRSVRTGAYCTYQPDPSSPVDWEL